MSQTALWHCMARILLTQEGKIRASFRTAQGLPPVKQLKSWHSPADREQAKSWLEGWSANLASDLTALTILRLLLNWAGSSTAALDSNWQTLLTELVDYCHQAMEKQGLVDFNYISLSLQKSLRLEENAQLMDVWWQSSVSHLFLDECQDLSALQWEILSQLMQGMAYEQRTFFVVGDPNQAIYYFRGAEIGMFARFESFEVSGLPKRNLELTQNFRSDLSVVSCVNAFLAQQSSAQTLPVLGLDRTIFSEASCNRAGQVSCWEYASPAEEAWGLSHWTTSLPSHWKIGILTRDRMSLAPFAQALKAAQLDYTITTSKQKSMAT